VACAVALANIRLLQRERIVERVQEELGPHLARHFDELAGHPLVGEAQTCGMMGALQLVRNKASGEAFDPSLEVGMVCRGHCFGNGLVMRAVADRMIVAPPLVMTTAQIDEMVALIRRCLDLTLSDVKHRGWL
jgi:putrescine aminotransferase